MVVDMAAYTMCVCVCASTVSAVKQLVLAYYYINVRVSKKVA